MPETVSNKITTVIKVTLQDMKSLIVQKAQQQGYIDYEPDEVRIDRINLDDEGPRDPDNPRATPGFLLTFTGPRT